MKTERRSVRTTMIAAWKEVRNTGGTSELFWQIDGLADSLACGKGGKEAVRWMDGHADSQ